MTDVAFAPQWQRSRRGRVPLVLLAAVLGALAIAARPSVVIDERDLTCPSGMVAVPAGPAYWAQQCLPDNGAGWTRTVPIARRYGLYLNGFGVRIFEVDRLGGVILGPG
jgi:hypothetical protein